ncbi:hypothetical protein DDB_G0294276 [Dictyostelium discoideum AX4]|uniref:Uncharacterized protein n=1 Tax=Dictyostelium discoideum TaxID=44689 RepID=Q54AQ8_DICDI|nr:hypothetical protein DDB_G0294276 [Dictyostelium discoideum AX4]EAL60349.1 hypothetical protein DDB_G0294276 [Dictyostelium discoideum AX4]|eukprot:XP_628762.1 hypothetical protein DDB_G0294276 [Dictyostelium discoideum AX4]
MGLGQRKSHYRNYCRDSGCGCIGVSGFLCGPTIIKKQHRVNGSWWLFLVVVFKQNPAYLSLAHLLVDG